MGIDSGTCGAVTGMGSEAMPRGRPGGSWGLGYVRGGPTGRARQVTSHGPTTGE